VTGALLEIRGVRKDFGGLQVLRGVDLALGAGELRCVIGPNGCGKTTLFNLVTGALAPSAGRILFCGEEITGRPPHEISRLGIARKFQVPGLYPSLSVAENLEVPLLSARAAAGPLALLRPARRGAQDMRELLDQFGLARFAARPAGTLPHGLKQWLEIAMLLACGPRLILLDEPTAGMSAAETTATVELIRRIQSERGVAVLVIEHDMSFVRQLAAPVVVMLRGSVLFEGSYQDIQAHPEVREAYLGQAAAC
jgi:urea transport system ATP-binding protein